MGVRLLSILAALVLLTACETTPESAADSSGTGGTDSGAGASRDVTSDLTDTQTGEEAGPVPGSAEDFVLFAGDRVFFDFDSYDITAEGRATLERQAEWLGRYPNVTITMEGHCDERGTREYNLALGERRAQAAKSFLVALGVEENRVTTISYGRERPEVVGSNEEAWAQNRRAVTVIN
ncbi:MAG: peptidoglycan-associated lipoprotein Pal [Alphaproteobacteria bacterium]|nr:peptidoglycan-associated lipoprotein Pal [Alphaproteobacteria bacterium]